VKRALLPALLALAAIIAVAPGQTLPDPLATSDTIATAAPRGDLRTWKRGASPGVRLTVKERAGRVEVAWWDDGKKVARVLMTRRAWQVARQLGPQPSQPAPTPTPAPTPSPSPSPSPTATATPAPGVTVERDYDFTKGSAPKDWQLRTDAWARRVDWTRDGAVLHGVLSSDGRNAAALGQIWTKSLRYLTSPTTPAESYAVDVRMRGPINTAGTSAQPGWWPQIWLMTETRNQAGQRTYFELDGREDFGRDMRGYAHLHTYMDSGGTLRSRGMTFNDPKAVVDTVSRSGWITMVRGVAPDGKDFATVCYDGRLVLSESPIQAHSLSKQAPSYIILGMGKTTRETASWQPSTFDLNRANGTDDARLLIPRVVVRRGPGIRRGECPAAPAPVR
jgi:hypothetical protein